MLAILSLLFACEQTRQLGYETEKKLQSETEARVIGWLEQVPFADLDNHHKPVRVAIDWDSWFRTGREIVGIEGLLRKFLREQDGRVYLPQVAYALGWIGTRDSTPELIRALGARDLMLRIEAAAALGRVGDNRGVAPLCHLAEYDDNINVRANAYLSLGKLGDMFAKPVLINALKDRSQFVVDCAKEALTLLEKSKMGEDPKQK